MAPSRPLFLLKPYLSKSKMGMKWRNWWPSHSWCSDTSTGGFWFLQVASGMPECSSALWKQKSDGRMGHRYRACHCSWSIFISVSKLPSWHPSIISINSVVQGLSRLTSRCSLDTRTRNVLLTQVRKVVSKAHNVECRRHLAFKMRLLDTVTVAITSVPWAGTGCSCSSFPF